MNRECSSRTLHFIERALREEKFDRLRAVIDEKAIELEKARKRLAEAREAATKTVDKELAKNLFLKYVGMPAGKEGDCHTVLHAVFGISNDEIEEARQLSSGSSWTSWLR